MMIRRMIAAGMVILMTLAGAGGTAESTESVEVLLPDGAHRVTIPGDMVFQEPSEEETQLKGILTREPDLEMLIFSYEAGDASARELAEELRGAGREAQVREIDGVEFLVFQDTDEADGARCVGYAYMNEGRMIEISFFYATEEAMGIIREIMESFHS